MKVITVDEGSKYTITIRGQEGWGDSKFEYVITGAGDSKLDAIKNALQSFDWFQNESTSLRRRIVSA